MFGPVTGTAGRSALEAYASVFRAQSIDFDRMDAATQLDTEFSGSAGVTFWTTTTITGIPLLAPHNVRITGEEYVSGPHGIGATPFPNKTYDSRASYEIRFNEPQRWAGLERVWSSWNEHCITRFYSPAGELLAELNAFPERFVGYVSPEEDESRWIAVIECTGATAEGIPQVGPSDDLLFGRQLDTEGPRIVLNGNNPVVLRVDSPYIEPGYTATDDYDGDVTATVNIAGSVDTSATGFYTLRYFVSDSWNNPAAEVTRIVTIVDDNPPPVAVLHTPSGFIDATKRPVFSWDPVATAEWYELTILRDGKTYFQKWLKAASWTPTWDLAAGDYTWAVATWNPYGDGPASVPSPFTIALMVPPRISLIAPEVEAETDRPAFAWSKESYAAWYHIVIQRDGKTVVGRWVQGEETYTPSHEDRLRYGRYTWWVQAWGQDGLGPWSEPMRFDYGVVEPWTPTGLLVETRRPVFSWAPLEDAAWYRVWVTRNGAFHLSTWIQGSNDLTLADDLPFGSYTWYVQAWNEKGQGPWSQAETFGIGAAFPLWPLGSVDGSPLSFVWDDSACGDAAWYRIQMLREDVVVADFWVEQADTVLTGAERTAYPPADDVPVLSGNYTWRIQTWRPDGLGPWSDPAVFTAP